MSRVRINDENIGDSKKALKGELDEEQIDAANRHEQEKLQNVGHLEEGGRRHHGQYYRKYKILHVT